MNKKSGFTLIELLAVIVILAVIALIATPLIMGTITKAKRNAMKDTAYGILKAGEQYAGEALLYSDNNYNGETIPLPDNSKLQYKGGNGTTGELKISKDGNLAIAIHDNQFCAMKTFNQSEVVVKNYDAETCKIDIETELSCFETKEIHEVTVEGINYQKWCEVLEMDVCDKNLMEYSIKLSIAMMSLNDVENFQQELQYMKDMGIIEHFTIDENPSLAITGYSCGGQYLNRDNDHTEGIDMNPIIPSTIDGKKVIMIGKQAFSSGYQGYEDGSHDTSSVVYSVALPSTLKYIDAQAFGHNEIHSIVIPQNVVGIAGTAFSYDGENTNLQKIINQTGRKFPWEATLGKESIEFFETGTITLNSGKQVEITK